MSAAQDRCPSPAELERGYWSDDAQVRAHAGGGCAACAAAWCEIADLADAARALPAPTVTPERREELRTAILTQGEPAAAPRAAAWWRLALPLVPAGAVGLAWALWPVSAATPVLVPVAPPDIVAVTAAGADGGAAVAPGPAVARLVAHDGARYLRAAEPPDEILRLVEGTLSVEAAAAPGVRLRVVTGDAELSASDAALDVTARGDRLTLVRVLRGRAELRRTGEVVQVVSAGERWEAREVQTLVVVPDPALLAPRPGPRPASVPRSEPPPPVERESVLVPEPLPLPPAVPEAAAPPARRVAQDAFDEGWRLIRAGDFAGAAAAFEAAGRSASGADGDAALVEDARFWAAVALARAAQTTRAMAAFEAFLRDHPGSVRAGEASVMLGWLLVERGDREGAERRFRSAAKDPSPRVRASAEEGLAAVERSR